MTWKLDSQAAAVAEALALGSPRRVGWFRFYFDDKRWEWSDELHRMHGYQPGTVDITTELVLSHKHPDDRERVAETIQDMIVNRVAFSTRHRIVDASGTDRHVVVVGDLFSDEHDDVVGTHGFYVDVSPGTCDAVEDAVTAKVAAIAKTRGPIDQTKGMLMFAYDIDEDAAFNILKTLSQVHNIKLVTLAEQIAADFRSAASSLVPAHATLDRLLFTAVERITPSSEE